MKISDHGNLELYGILCNFLTSFTPGISSKAIVSGEPMLANFFTKYGNNKWTDWSSGISYTCTQINPFV